MDTVKTETITAGELAEILRIRRQSLDQIAKKEGWPHDVANKRGDRWFILDRLPAEIQERIRRHRLGIDEESVEEMASRSEIQVPRERLKDPKTAGYVRMICECLAVPENARGRGRRISEIASESGYNRATAYRGLDRVRKGLPLLNGRRNYGHKFNGLNIVVRAWDPEAARIAIEAICGNRQGREEGLSLYNRIAGECGKLDLRCGSLSSFYDLQRRIDPAMIKYRDTGHRGLREDIVPAIRRDFTAYRAMECLIGDQHKADYYCYDRNGDIITLELFCWLDFRTQMAWPAIAYKHYNRYTVGQALINAVRWGLPSIVYTDWGKPEESNYVSLLVEQLSGLGVRCDSIRHTNAKVRHPQAKPIEGWFGWLDRNLRNARIPGYMKRLADSRENDLHQKEIKELAKAGGLLSIEEMPGRIFAVIEGWNEHLFKNRGCDNGKSPLQVYREETAKYPVATLDQDTLEYIFLPQSETKVKRSQVRVKNDWLGSITYFHPELAMISGETVEVRRRPFDTSCVWVFHKALEGGVCCADEWSMINPKNRDQVAERISHQNSLVKQVREKFRAYAPPAETVPRINRATRAGKQMKNAESARGGQARKAEGTFRVCRTPLDEDWIDEGTGEIAAEASGRSGFGSLFRKPRAPEPIPFAVNWNRPPDKE